jgi:hypothetical protein
MAENGIENALRIIAPCIYQIGAYGRADSVRQRALRIHHGDGLGDVPSTTTHSIDALLKSIGGLSHVVQASKNRQSRNVHIT